MKTFFAVWKCLFGLWEGDTDVPWRKWVDGFQRSIGDLLQQMALPPRSARNIWLHERSAWLALRPKVTWYNPLSWITWLLVGPRQVYWFGSGSGYERLHDFLAALANLSQESQVKCLVWALRFRRAVAWRPLVKKEKEFYNLVVIRLLALLPRTQTADLVPADRFKKIVSLTGLTLGGLVRDHNNLEPIATILACREMPQAVKLLALREMERLIRKRLAYRDRTLLVSYAILIKVLLESGFGETSAGLEILQRQLNFVIVADGEVQLFSLADLIPMLNALAGGDCAEIRYSLAWFFTTNNGGFEIETPEEAGCVSQLLREFGGKNHLLFEKLTTELADWQRRHEAAIEASEHAAQLDAQLRQGDAALSTDVAAQSEAAPEA
jgi:hypothetical protein